MTSEDKGVRSATGGCLCGAVRFEASGPLREVVCCHCGQCRRSHGHFAAYTAIKSDDLTMTRTEGLSWYPSSEKARRGFCRACGSSLFWEPLGVGYVAVAAGSIDPPNGLETRCHIHVADKGDYYAITDGLEQRPRGLSDRG